MNPPHSSTTDSPAPGARRSAAVDVTRWRGERALRERDRVAVEEPLEIRVNDEPLAVTMRTPGDDRELAAGFALTEGLVLAGEEIEHVEPCAIAEYGNVVNLRLSPEATERHADRLACSRRELYVSSSCGLCGKQSIDRIRQQVRPIEDRFEVTRQVIASLPQRMREAQATFDSTGGLHAAALFRPDGSLQTLREDVGRHNAADKAIGDMLLLDRVPLRRTIMLVSGRTSFEILQKAAMARIGVVCAVSAPSSLAVETAAGLGLTLIGFLRPGRMNVYQDAASRVR